MFEGFKPKKIYIEENPKGMSLEEFIKKYKVKDNSKAARKVKKKSKKAGD